MKRIDDGYKTVVDDAEEMQWFDAIDIKLIRVWHYLEQTVMWAMRRVHEAAMECRASAADLQVTKGDVNEGRLAEESAAMRIVAGDAFPQLHETRNAKYILDGSVNARKSVRQRRGVVRSQADGFEKAPGQTQQVKSRNESK